MATGGANPGRGGGLRLPASLKRLGAKLITFGLLFGVLPNVPFWLLAPRMGIVTPGLINLDGILLGLAAMFVRKGWVVALFGVDFALDIVYGIRATYGTNYVEVFLSLRYLFSVVSVGQILLIGGASALLIAAIGWTWLRWSPRPRGAERAWMVALVVAMLLPLAVASRQQRISATQHREDQWRLGHITSSALAPTFANVAASTTRSPAVSLYHAWKREQVWSWLRGAYSKTVWIPSATDAAKAEVGAARDNFVIVLVESWGLAADARLRASLEAPFHSAALETRYEARTGEIGYRGSTAAGELRELCNYRLEVVTAPLTISRADMARCVPWKLLHAGYETMAVDSAASFWPGGTNWYKLLGFEHVVAYDQLHRQGMTTFTAGPFRSIRDDEVAAWVGRTLSANTADGHRKMIFWLTMSAHLPIHEPLSGEYDGDCGVAALTRRSSATCGWYKVELRTLESIAQMAATPALGSTSIIVVGDHAPPFLDSARDEFSATEVPYVWLSPRVSSLR